MHFKLLPSAKPITAVVAPGWSLTREQCLALQERSDINKIVIGNAHRLFPEADILYHADRRWWVSDLQAQNFKGHKVSVACMVPRKGRVSLETCEDLGVDYVRESRQSKGLDPEAGYVVLGGHSGYQAVNLAVHYQPKILLLVGFDLCLDPREGENKGRAHFDGDHPEGVYRKSPYGMFIRTLGSLKPSLATLGIRVYNCNQHSALECFEKVELEKCLLSVK